VTLHAAHSEKSCCSTTRTADTQFRPTACQHTCPKLAAPQHTTSTAKLQFCSSLHNSFNPCTPCPYMTLARGVVCCCWLSRHAHAAAGTRLRGLGWRPLTPHASSSTAQRLGSATPPALPAAVPAAAARSMGSAAAAAAAAAAATPWSALGCWAPWYRLPRCSGTACRTAAVPSRGSTAWAVPRGCTAGLPRSCTARGASCCTACRGAATGAAAACGASAGAC
jgi:hypothetical protein